MICSYCEHQDAGIRRIGLSFACGKASCQTRAMRDQHRDNAMVVHPSPDASVRPDVRRSNAAQVSPVQLDGFKPKPLR